MNTKNKGLSKGVKRYGKQTDIEISAPAFGWVIMDKLVNLLTISVELEKLHTAHKDVKLLPLVSFSPGLYLQSPNQYLVEGAPN